MVFSSGGHSTNKGILEAVLRQGLLRVLPESTVHSNRLGSFENYCCLTPPQTSEIRISIGQPPPSPRGFLSSAGESNMQPGPRVTGRDLQLSLFMDVGRRPPGTRREPSSTWKVPRAPALVWAQKCAREKQRAFFVILPNSASSHGGRKFSLAAGPVPNCQHARLFHSS